jgi:hypothetical protein
VDGFGYALSFRMLHLVQSPYMTLYMAGQYSVSALSTHGDLVLDHMLKILANVDCIHAGCGAAG